MNKNKIEKIKQFFIKYKQVKLVYVFGSQANGSVGPMSDYDFAVYIDEKNKKKRSELRCR